MSTKLLWLGDSPTLFTGFGRVAKEILTRLHKTGDYDIASIGWFYDGRPYDTTEFPFNIYRTGNSEYGRTFSERSSNVSSRMSSFRWAMSG